MKKIILITALWLFSLNYSYAQTRSQLNFGLVAISYDIPVSENIAISPFAGTDFNLDWLIAGVKANYYFDNLFGLADAWDVYGGANAGFGIDLEPEKENDLDVGLQVGGRWFWNENWGLYLELGGGKLGPTGGLGVTLRL